MKINELDKVLPSEDRIFDDEWYGNDESTIDTKFVVEKDGYAIYEILPTSYDYYVDKEVLNEIVEKHFTGIILDEDKDYFVYKDGELLNV